MFDDWKSYGHAIMGAGLVRFAPALFIPAAIIFSFYQYKEQSIVQDSAASDIGEFLIGAGIAKVF